MLFYILNLKIKIFKIIIKLQKWSSNLKFREDKLKDLLALKMYFRYSLTLVIFWWHCSFISTRKEIFWQKPCLEKARWFVTLYRFKSVEVFRKVSISLLFSDILKNTMKISEKYFFLCCLQSTSHRFNFSTVSYKCNIKCKIYASISQNKLEITEKYTYWI